MALEQEVGKAGGDGVTEDGCRDLVQVLSVFQVCPQ